METTYYLAVDIGASSGRHMLSHLEDGKLVLEEIYRFPNGMTEKNGHKVWDVDRLFAEILNGMKQCARLCTSKAHYLASELEKIGCKLKYTGEFFHEFVTETACPNCRKKILDALAEKNILGGAEVDGGILWCVTELVSKEKLDEVVAIVKEVLGK